MPSLIGYLADPRSISGARKNVSAGHFVATGGNALPGLTKEELNSLSIHFRRIMPIQPMGHSIFEMEPQDSAVKHQERPNKKILNEREDKE